MDFTIDFSWNPRAALENVGIFAQLVHDWLGDLAKLDERLRYLGRKGRDGEVGAGLPRDVLMRMIERGQGVMGLSSAWGPLEPSLRLSASANHVAGVLPGRVYLSLEAPMARESALLRGCLASGIERFSPDQALIWTSYRPAGQSAFNVWKQWRPAADTLSPLANVLPHGEPTSTEPWLDGILQTWPENEPAKLVPALA